MEQDNIIRFASRMDYLPPYLFGMINKMKMEKRRNGDDVIDLGMGNPMDPTPDAVIEKLVNVAKDPKSHRYPESSGLPNLKKRLPSITTAITTSPWMRTKRPTLPLGPKKAFPICAWPSWAPVIAFWFRPPRSPSTFMQR